MAQIAYLTTAGQAAIADARFNGYKISIVQYKVGDTLITETDPVVIRNYNTLPGSIVYDSGVSPTDNTLTYSTTGDVGIVISVYLNSAIGDFTLGSVGLYLDDGTLFAILVLDETYSKVKNAGSVVGNIITFPFTFVLTIQDVLDLEITPEGVASLPDVNTEADLPLYNLAPYSNYFIRNLATTGQAAIAYKGSDAWQYTVASNHNAFEHWLKVDSANFDSNAIDGSAVYYNLATGNWSSLDGDDVEQKVYGIRLGNGVRTAGFYYKLNSFVPGYDYYADTAPAAGRLTTRSSKYFVGTAINASLLKLKFSYSDASFDGVEKSYYQAAIDAAGVINLTLDDAGKYPDTYINGSSISFICPVDTTANQQVKVGNLSKVTLTKLNSSNSGYKSNVGVGDITQGSLVQAVYLSADEGFRLLFGGTAANYDVGTTSGRIPVIGTSSATELLAGLLELATNSEAISGTDTSRALTPANLVATLANSKSIYGYTRLPNGIYLQWGREQSVAPNLAYRTVTYPIAFPVYGAFVIIASPDIPNNSGDGNACGGVSISQSQFRIYNADDGAQTISWLAIGY